ncbi:hypothetical protein [Microbacterium arborescens]|uniref:hypothetical protein n=1 Tax=Microbacterium arborescens TaxID=33883 RepID=UPI003C74D8FD
MNDNNSAPTDRTPDDQPTTPLAPTGQPSAEHAPVAPTPAAPTPAASTPTDHAAAAHTSTEHAPVSPRRRGRRTALLAGGAVVAAALLVGGGAAVGAAVADDDDEDDDRVASLSSSDDRADDATGSDRDSAAGAGAGATDAYGAASLDDLTAVADAARAAAEGDIVSLDADRDGRWDVQLIAADGSETGVRVAADGTATVRETEAADADDAAAQNVLDAATLRTLVEAALAEADGRILDVDADDDPRSPFDVSVLTADRGVVDVTLDVDGTVLGTEIDD